MFLVLVGSGSGLKAASLIFSPWLVSDGGWASTLLLEKPWQLMSLSPHINHDEHITLRTDVAVSSVHRQSPGLFMFYFQKWLFFHWVPLSFRKRPDCCTFILKLSVYCFWSFPRLLFHRSNCPSVQSGVNFPLVATSREVGWGPMDLKCLDNVSSCGHRNIKLLEDGLQPWS